MKVISARIHIRLSWLCLSSLPFWVLGCTPRSPGESGAKPGQGTASTAAAHDNRSRVKPSGPPARKIQEGLPIPPFDLPLLGEPERRISNATLRGSVVLLKFWATSCPTCAEEMDHLHALQKRYVGRGLVVVTIDAFESAEAVRAFRRDRWPMPWRHVVLEDDRESEQVLRTFEVGTLPTSILIDRNGIIAATVTGARGTNLDETLAHLFSVSR